MIYCEYRFASENEDCVSNQSAEGFLTTLSLYKNGEVQITRAIVDGIRLDVNHLLEVLIL